MIPTQPYRQFSLVIFSLLLSISAQAKPDEVDESAVRNCQYIAKVVGNSGYGKNPRWQAIAKSYAQRKAEALGATHIVYTDMRTVGSFNGEADAKAYLCQ